jgi:tetratricopeptide (TPR) repeat protein
MLALAAQPARAQPAPIEPAAPTASAAPQTEAPRPWAEGVPASEQAVALELYAAGNREFTESRFTQALARYKEAIRHWDHPAIRFNIAVCLINLDQALEAHDNLERGLAYGEPPLGPDAYGQAMIYRKLLAGQLGRLTIRCQQPGMRISVDGKPLFTGPGAVDQIVIPGEHQVVATKAGFLTDSKTLVAVAGKVASYEVRPIAIVAEPTMVRRWSVWLPWAVFAGGGALAAGGAWSYSAAADNFDRYDRVVAARCAQRCSAEMLASYPELRRYQDHGNAEQIAAYSMFAVGGAAVLGGVVGLILNQPHVKSDVIHVQPMVAPTAGGAAVSVRWSF